MKKPLITRITNKTGSPLIMDVTPGFPRIYVGAHKTVDYPGDIFTVLSEPAAKSILKLDPEKFIIKYLVYGDSGYSPIWVPLKRLDPVSWDLPASFTGAAFVDYFSEKLSELSEADATHFVEFIEGLMAELKEGLMAELKEGLSARKEESVKKPIKEEFSEGPATGAAGTGVNGTPADELKKAIEDAPKGIKDTDPKVVKDIIEKAEEVFVEKPAEVSTEPAKEPVEEAPKEEAPAVDDFFTTTVEDTTEDTKKTAKKRKAK